VLTQEQKAAVESPHQDTVVIAGAGAGKTRVIVERIKWMLAQGIDPQTIVAITFTRKAAAEIRERLTKECGAFPDVHLGTFHSLALDFLDDKDLTVVSESVCYDILSRINRTVKKNRVTWRQVEAYRYAKALGRNHKDDGGVIKRAVDSYEGILRHEGSIDFMAMMVRGCEIAPKMAGFHVLVDEAQDTDDLQWKFVHALRKDKTLFSVGDSRQQLYVWRNVNPDSFENLPGERYHLTSTFRFGADLANMTNEIALRSGHEGPGIMPFADDKVTTVHYSSATDVSRMLAKVVRSMTEPNETVAVLCRYNSQVEQYTEELQHLGVSITKPVKIDHSTMYAFLQYLCSPWNESLRRAFTSMPDSIGMCPSVTSLSAESAARYIEAAFRKDSTIAEVLDNVRDTFSLRESRAWWLKNYGSHKLSEAVVDFSTRDENEEEDNDDQVRVMTVHGSKGLEFDHVFFPLAPVRNFNEDEWRVAYVACTRAKKTLHVSGMGNPVAEVACKYSAEELAMSQG
jgi:DNA helicase-2/ATP-dependent DNA helicase PcrA